MDYLCKSKHYLCVNIYMLPQFTPFILTMLHNIAAIYSMHFNALCFYVVFTFLHTTTVTIHQFLFNLTYIQVAVLIEQS